MQKKRFAIGRTLTLSGVLLILMAIIVTGITYGVTPDSEVAQTPAPTPTPTHSLSAKSADTTVTVNPSHVIASIPDRYLGFSFETSSVCDLAGAWDQEVFLDPNGERVNVFERLVENLGPQVLRIGGLSADATTWDPEGVAACAFDGSTLNEQSIDDLFALAHRMNTSIDWTVNLGDDNPTLYGDEAAYVVSQGSALRGLAIGNEPDRYVYNHIRSSGFSASTYVTEWNAYVKAIRSATNDSDYSYKLLGGDNVGDASWFSTFMAHKSANVSTQTWHFYPTYKSSADRTYLPTVANLLSASLMQHSAAQISSWAKQYPTVPLAISETNSVAGGGQKGVSDRFASALWGLDYMFTALEHGAKQINFHSGGGVYSPIIYSGSSWVVNPLYYAMLAFHYAAARGKVVTTWVTTHHNIAAHGVTTSDGWTYVVVINKELTHPAVVNVTTNTSYHAANALLLTAPLSVSAPAPAGIRSPAPSSAYAPTGVTLGGASVAADGSWTAKPMNVPVSSTSTGTIATVSVPAASAMIIGFNPQPTSQSSQSPMPTPQLSIPQPLSSIPASALVWVAPRRYSAVSR